jgi:sulfur carrier protein
MSKKINILVNGEPVQVLAGFNVQEVLKQQGYRCELLAIAVNETFVARTDCQQTLVQENDRVDIVAPMQGG